MFAHILEAHPVNLEANAANINESSYAARIAAVKPSVMTITAQTKTGRYAYSQFKIMRKGKRFQFSQLPLELGVKLNKEGQKVGARGIKVSPNGWSRIFWTDGDEFWLIDSTSLELSQEIENQCFDH